jgi:spermidine synthase
MAALGKHILVEFTGCSPSVMNDVSEIESSMVDAATKAGATVINATFHHFSPYGVSGVVVIQESHLAIHTWPEYGYAAVDLFTCGDQVDAWLSFDLLKEIFGATNYSAIEMQRGNLNLMQRMDFDISSSRSDIENRTNPKKYTRSVWFTDKDDDQALSLRYTGEVLFDQTSDYQRVRILESQKYGKFLALDDMVMTTEKDEFQYHEMISHPAIFTHPNPKKVLVIGGGDGGTVREVLRHSCIESVTMVEIDGLVVEACKKHLPGIASELENSKLDLRIEDGISFVANADPESYDVILVDGSDPVGPAQGLFTKEFYQNCYRALSNNGILVTQGESPRFNEEAFIDINSVIKSLFGQNNAFVNLFFVPTYPTGMWSFQWGVKGNINPLEINEHIVSEFVSKQDLNYYNYNIHKNAFALPNYVSKMLK